MTSKAYLVLGLGKTGAASALALTRRGDQVHVWDDNKAVREQFMQDISKYVKKDNHLPQLVETPEGWSDELLKSVAADGLVISPGIPHLYPQPHPCAMAARKLGIPLLSDIDIWLEAVPETVTIIGVTGTNGKSTTTELIGFIAEASGHASFVAGNLGVSPLAHAAPERNSICILEISSYQLDLMTSRRLDCAVILNIGIDHLERHGGLDGYINSKISILDRLRPNGVAVVGVDDNISRQLFQLSRGRPQLRAIPISGNRQVVRGVYAKDGKLVSSLHKDTNKDIADLSEFTCLLGSHNHQNIAAALAATHVTEVCTMEAFSQIAPAFSGLSHRQEQVADCRLSSGKTLTFINDSKATNLDAAKRSLKSFENIHWIVGGREKENCDLSELAPHLGRVKSIWLIGEAADGPLGHWLQDISKDGKNSDQGHAQGFKVHKPHTLDIAVRQAANFAETQAVSRDENATVLLAPACASFDQFENFEQRGDAFRDYARAIASLISNPDFTLKSRPNVNQETKNGRAS